MMTKLSDEQRKLIRELTKKHQLEEISPLLEDLAQNAVQLVVTEPDDYSKPGITRIGGVPDLPPGIEWPKNEGGYLVFVAQINLAELPVIENSPLSNKGMLYFFHGSINSLDHQVLFFDEEQNILERVVQPTHGLINIEPYSPANYQPYKVQMRRFISLPYYFSNFWRIWEKCHDGYFDLEKELYGFPDEHETERSQILGYPAATGYDTWNQAQLIREGKTLCDTTEIREPQNWYLLLELGSHYDVGMSWSDAGYLQFLIHRDDLMKCDFSRTYCGIVST